MQTPTNPDIIIMNISYLINCSVQCACIRAFFSVLQKLKFIIIIIYQPTIRKKKTPHV